MCNATGRRINDQGTKIPDPEADAIQAAALEAENAEANAEIAEVT